MRLAVCCLSNEYFQISDSISESLLLLVCIATAEESFRVEAVQILNNKSCIADDTGLLVQMVERQTAIGVDLRDLQLDIIISHGSANILEEADTFREVLDSLLVGLLLELVVSSLLDLTEPLVD